MKTAGRPFFEIVGALGRNVFVRVDEIAVFEVKEENGSEKVDLIITLKSGRDVVCIGVDRACYEALLRKMNGGRKKIDEGVLKS